MLRAVINSYMGSLDVFHNLGWWAAGLGRARAILTSIARSSAIWLRRTSWRRWRGLLSARSLRMDQLTLEVTLALGARAMQKRRQFPK
jgi:uncharacterized membrane protein